MVGVEKREALRHLREAYAQILYFEPRTAANKQRMAAISRKFWVWSKPEPNGRTPVLRCPPKADPKRWASDRDRRIFVSGVFEKCGFNREKTLDTLMRDLKMDMPRARRLMTAAYQRWHRTRKSS